MENGLPGKIGMKERVGGAALAFAATYRVKVSVV
jgi:hypothetical protein